MFLNVHLSLSVTLKVFIYLLFHFLTKYYKNIHIINKKAEKQVNKLLTLLYLKFSEELSWNHLVDKSKKKETITVLSICLHISVTKIQELRWSDHVSD